VPEVVESTLDVASEAGLEVDESIPEPPSVSEVDESNAGLPDSPLVLASRISSEVLLLPQAATVAARAVTASGDHMCMRDSFRRRGMFVRPEYPESTVDPIREGRSVKSLGAW
jgi:hypothetical protein